MKNEQNSKNICFGDLGIIEIAKKVQRKKVFSLDLSAAKWPSCITVVWGESAPLPISLTPYVVTIWRSIPVFGQSVATRDAQRDSKIRIDPI